MDTTDDGPRLDFALKEGATAVCTLSKDGTFVADWPAIAKLKDKFLAGDYRPEDYHSTAVVAALWFARNSR